MSVQLLHESNAELSRAEIALRHIHLRSMPRYLTLVIANRCNLDCIHCYQLKNRDSLLMDPEIGGDLRREFQALYPYLSTLRVQGGETLAIKGFRDLVEDVAHAVDRPLISISTNGTLIDDDWARRIVEMPFQTVTVSIDGAQPETLASIRRGAELATVLQSIDRLQAWKKRLDSPLPQIDVFFVVMRSNFREIPAFLDMVAERNIIDVTFQTMILDERNLSRFPSIGDELITESDEVAELHALIEEALPDRRERFRRVAFIGFQSLFERHGLDPSTIDETRFSIHPDQEIGPPPADAPPARQHHETRNGQPADGVSAHEEGENRLCPNPWSTLFVTEAGDVSLCFLSTPIGNIYEQPLVEIWNSPEASAMRANVLAGRYEAAGCPPAFCSWREGCPAPAPDGEEVARLHADLRRLSQPSLSRSGLSSPEISPRLRAVRRMMADQRRRIAELEAGISQVWAQNGELHDRAQRHIWYLERALRTVKAALIAEGNGDTREIATYPAVERPIFVVGSPRSGTSMMQWALRRHPNLWGGQESDFLAPLVDDLRKAYEFGIRRKGLHWLSGQNVGWPEFMDFVGQGINALYTSRSDGRRWVDQTPQYTIRLEPISLLFPKAQFIVMVRDGRQVVSSLRSFVEPQDIVDGSRTWTEFNEAALHFAARTGNERVIFVRFERIVMHTRSELNRLFDFLGETFSDESLAHIQDRKPMNSSFGVATSAETLTPRWHDWSEDDRATFIAIAGDMLLRLDYERDHSWATAPEPHPADSELTDLQGSRPQREGTP